MERKFKERHYRLTLLFAAAMLLILATTPQGALSRLVLSLGGLGLGAVALEQRRLPALPGTLAPLLLGLPLALLLWLDPQRHGLWLWAWAAVLVLPQAPWLWLLHGLLAALCWWQVYPFVGTEQGLLMGGLLAALMLLGVARGLEELPLRQGLALRTRLLAQRPLHSRRQLAQDMLLETTRCTREGSHGELLLLRCPSRHQQAMLDALMARTCHYETCFQIDNKTLAALLISRNEETAVQRRAPLLDTLPEPFQARFIGLAPSLCLDAQLKALAQQEQVVAVQGREV
ncbi:hypothetical protein SAMN02745148_02695 [Modicisalibacter ilicicola DSM 19980]|uniref:GGDEF domain-containing protein n=1 Tax=Modicisalibacter ilicicola DSM 19980 TaxID=1121942 RepID=A0A1M5BUN5_9GAMM|nr:hypothetical protein [Halomonas ilicicola]SHF46273.1 hypothetical protein SAMN02745148_02695 [Halomonas ilicicola DSM 19980]